MILWRGELQADQVGYSLCTLLTSFGYVKLLCEELSIKTGSAGRCCYVIDTFLLLPLFIRHRILTENKIRSVEAGVKILHVSFWRMWDKVTKILKSLKEVDI